MKAAPGETVELVCQVRGFPEANDIFWYRGGIQLDNAQLGDRYHIRSAGQPYGAESVLTIKELRHSDFNEYNCTATNVHGTHSMKLDLVANGNRMVGGQIYKCTDCRRDLDVFDHTRRHSHLTYSSYRSAYSSAQKTTVVS